MEAWEKVWQDGFAKVLGPDALKALKTGLLSDDVGLTQGSTTTPPPLLCVQDWPCEGACAVGYAGWKGLNLQTVGEVKEFFAKTCFEVDQILGEQAACRWFLNWFDENPRKEVFTKLLKVLETRT